MEKARGCLPGTKGAEHPVKIGRVLEIFDRCPKAWLREEGAGLSRLVSDAFFFDAYKIAPCGGGLLDQPSKFVDALNVVAQVKSNAVEQG
jgi:hypothetical protein